jgi:hypothetical protein
MPSELHIRRILNEVEAGNNTSQRSISSNVGIALGLTNLLLQRLVRKGWIRVIHIKPNRVRYLITPTGIAEKARMTRSYLESTIAFYAEARDRIRKSLGVLSATWDSGDLREAPEKRIVFFGAGDVAEIGYVCLLETDLRLVGVVDDGGRSCSFFGIPVHPPSSLSPSTLACEAFHRLVVMSFETPERVSSKLSALQIPPEVVFWV